ncbi:UDP-N-acetylglucosamine 1-carboxyvinyltransferase 1 [uncultured Ruminococcus sp.]|uniref:UDP-N-acetylglucosamine 1-carboxyvinyltransferase n=1 Tax=Massiliimalia timonensis TaxID=1987501 RepID=A0A8J6PGB3_9FIRM|nr:UDP-N-acetylglucosamine 1-carboxyvinyltransferase [Massiliimalia timonensis]MBC8609725.1 UDP-N-acetylglucosamine 1-carboxyvinyltransferase [Massiliimalia timonensis]MBS7175935.1 UDP-N-acetylglucosamine 1-carboxyvinyltransferase [Clostridiales bacterium]SCH28672.1 UDP-N-acetylglucosamine 1-carboxyvinyltransferase 1 [uncultured Ruminococcus sp.]SCH32768.1 UDP-N-acetylglucosamine 1-carboxyvinyltransferase 1 [uncultured Clostridium sp.]
MSVFEIEGGRRLAGEIDIQGAKNSSLPILAATLLGKGEHIIHNCPRLSDVDAAVEILRYLGCKVTREGNTLTVDSRDVSRWDIPEELMQEMRSSIVFLGAILARMGKAKLSMPGGCELGPRPIDLHLEALEKLGADIQDEYGFLHCSVQGRLKGTKIALSFPSVGATENILLASVLSEGITTVHNAAQEPEIVDLADFLNRCGAKVSGAGKSTIVIEGVNSLSATEHSVIPDRIVAATYLCCGAVTGGEVLLKRVNSSDLECMLPIFEQMGNTVSASPHSIYLKAPKMLKSVRNIRTMPYPGFPTDAQAPLMAALTVANGSSMFVENIFESRYKHVPELCRMGADIKVEGRVCVVNGVSRLTGAVVRAEDLRGGAALMIAGLKAQGVTTLRNIHHIERGYEDAERYITQLGGSMKRKKEN